MSSAPIGPGEFVAANLCADEQEVIEEGIRQLLRAHPEYKTEIAVHRYVSEEASLGKAADIAGVSVEEMKSILSERGITLRGPETAEEIRDDAANIRGVGS